MNKYFFLVFTIGLTLFSLSTADAGEPVKHQITGVFSMDREQDLRDLFQQIPEIKLVDIEFETAVARFEYDPATLFPNTTPEQIVERFDNLLRNASNHTFGVKPLCAIAHDKLELIEIRVAGLDCKACCLAAYESIYRIDGVEHATASFKDGLVRAWVHPDKTERSVLEKSLEQKGVTLVAP